LLAGSLIDIVQRFLRVLSHVSGQIAITTAPEQPVDASIAQFLRRNESNSKLLTGTSQCELRVLLKHSASSADKWEQGIGIREDGSPPFQIALEVWSILAEDLKKNITAAARLSFPHLVPIKVAGIVKIPKPEAVRLRKIHSSLAYEHEQFCFTSTIHKRVSGP